MNIRKIIKEEIEDFDWIKDIPSSDLYIGSTFAYRGAGFSQVRPMFLSVSDIKGNRVVVDIYTIIDGKKRKNKQGPINFTKHEFVEKMGNKSFVKVDDQYLHNINESINDFDWINDESIDGKELLELILQQGATTIPFKHVGGYLNLYGTPIKSLGNLESVGGALNLEGMSIKSLGNLKSVGGYLDLRGTPIKSLGNLESVGGALNLAGTSIESLGNLESVGGYLDLAGTPIKSLDNLESVGRNLNLYGTPIESLGNLESVGGYLDLAGTPIKSLGNLEIVDSDLYLYGTKVESLGNLESIGGNLYLQGTQIESLGNLESVGGYLNLYGTPMAKKYSEQEIRTMVNVQGYIYL